MQDTDFYTELTKVERYSVDKMSGRDYACGVFKAILTSMFDCLNERDQAIFVATMTNINRSNQQ